MGGTSYALLTDLKVAIEEVDLDFNISLPPVWLHYNATTSHFKYYSERCPPPLQGIIVPLTDDEEQHPESQGESPSAKQEPTSKKGQIASDIFFNVVKDLEGMHA